MSNVLKRIQEQQQTRQKESPAGATQAIADQYISDIKAKAKDEARLEIQNELIESANAAELEGALKKLQAVESERDTLKELLTNERSQAAQANDLAKSLKAEIKNNSIGHEESESKYKETISSLSEKIRELELAVIEAKNKPLPAPIIQQEPKIVPSSFTLKHHRGPDGRLIESTVEPMYERPN